MGYKSFKKKVKKHFQEVIELKTSPHEIALGFAIGTAIAVLPLFALEPFLIGLAILLFKKISKISLILAFVVWNPFISALLIPISYSIGDLLLPGEPIITFRYELLNQVFIYTRRYILGSIILAAVLSFISYWIVYYLSWKYKKKQLPVLQVPLEIEVPGIEKKIEVKI